MTVVVNDRLDAPISTVWNLISDFGSLMRWHPDVSSCTLEGSGVGSERLVVIGSRVIRERLTELDECNHTLEYQIIDSPDPLSIGMRGRIRLNASGERHTDINWVSGFPETHPNSAGLNQRLAAYYPRRIEHLKVALSDQISKRTYG